MQHVLFIGLVWPEPASSAAGTRIMQLIDVFQTRGYTVTFASAASKSAYSYPLDTLGIREQAIALNDSRFDDWIKAFQPDIVVFDRFMVEEQYGWRVREQCPNALTLLDTEDLHFLRTARQIAERKQIEVDYNQEITKREIASILRCDLSLLISKAEIALLTSIFHISPKLFFYPPFLEEEISQKKMAKWKSYEERRDFIFIGNFLHEPNWHTVQILRKEVWPRLRKHIPNASLHIYGAYASEKVFQLHQPSERFFIKDRANDARETMQQYRVLLAPIRFGAGAKGKFIDAMQAGTPSVTTSIGAESMSENGLWNGFVTDALDDFATKAQMLYEDKALWAMSQQSGIQINNEQYNKRLFIDGFLESIQYMKDELQTHRKENFIGEILKTQQHNSLKYMSLWIEEKNKKESI